jgi:predicted RNase H-like HicB family nuclease
VVGKGIADKQVLCFAHERDGAWEGICPDFDIAVQGRSFEEVKAALEEAVVTYVEDALSEEPPVARRLLRRAAPWYVRRGHVMQFFFATLYRRDNEYRHAFNMPCAA